MKASEKNLLSFLGERNQFLIPLFQRPYSWNLTQCRQLWDDMVLVSQTQTGAGHFLGSIVYISTSIYVVGGVPQLLVIDGQQRLTTVTLALLALSDRLRGADGESEITQEQIVEFYLVNNKAKGDLRYKLMLTQSDKDTIAALVDDRPLPDPVSHRVIENYSFFRDELRRPGLDPNAIFRGLGKLVIVDIALDPDHDNPQLIFESLNSTGLDLSQSDLVRNYVLMRMSFDDQRRLYTDYWYPMERKFTQDLRSTELDSFLRDYLTAKTSRIPNEREIYSAFKAHVRASTPASMTAVLSDLHKHSGYYEQFAFQCTEDKKLKDAVTDINALRVDVAYPFLLEVFNDCHSGLLTQAELIEALRLVESYVFRRAICGIPTNTLNRTFANLAQELDKSRYMESLKAALLLKDSYRRYPNDEEFARELVVKDVYNFRNRNYLLRKLENYERKEKVAVENYTIEHVMPQNPNLSLEWQQELGTDWKTVHEKYLHTIGNLTLTGYNSPLSNRPFTEKRTIDGGFDSSPLRLNKSLAHLAKWDQAAIEKRAQTLAHLAVKVWPMPVLDDDVLRKYRKATQPLESAVYTLADHPKLRDPVLALFEDLRSRVLGLDSAVREEIKKYYIAYKTTTNFVDVIPMKSGLYLTLNLRFDQIIDPKAVCEDLTGVGTWGNGDVGLKLESVAQLDYTMGLVRQSLALRGAVIEKEATQWNEGTFMSELEKLHDAEEVDAAAAILDWAKRSMPDIWYGYGKQSGSFTPGLNHGGLWHQAIAVWTNGVVEVQFQYMQGDPPFDKEAKRRELYLRLKSIPGITLPESDDVLIRRPSIPLAKLTNGSAMDQFLAALDWFVTEVKATPA